ncbi:hypothetical protein KZX46_10475 [Polymorphobacter sp. PAMC 29334]|uniref:hypothetical protein n=1 Tax=Polymorphobacter sp. PAMC 29334 TaxID=2862331 RepID=UPI001C78F58D|nr:hypothetical protein [Polymorphobacter sp. PAMC 29334]QYE36308.1 hypothetical protein KZX46_10475 [Polymorphobacter sp. PAMC 29334]
MFAQLFSTVEPQRDAARPLLAAPFAALQQQQLFDLILGPGMALAVVPATSVPSRMHRQWDAHDIAALVAARRGSTTATSLAFLWGLPVYAVEQLVLARSPPDRPAGGCPEPRRSRRRRF